MYKGLNDDPSVMQIATNPQIDLVVMVIQNQGSQGQIGY